MSFRKKPEGSGVVKPIRPGLGFGSGSDEQRRRREAERLIRDYAAPITSLDRRTLIKILELYGFEPETSHSGAWTGGKSYKRKDSGDSVDVHIDIDGNVVRVAYNGDRMDDVGELLDTLKKEDEK